MPQEEVEQLADEEDGPFSASQRSGDQARINAVLDALVKAQERAGET